MKRAFSFILAATLAAHAAAATGDSAQLSVTYETTFKKVASADSLSKDLMRLDIGPRSSQFVSVVREWYVQNPNKTRRQSPHQGYNIFPNTVYKNLPTQGLVTAIHMPGWVTVQDSAQALFRWALAEGDTVVCGYRCQKATTTFRGRDWTAWYAPDLPYDDGPWKFCGLPGLVLCASEAEGIFAFRCVGIERGDGHAIEFPASSRMKVVTPRRAEELMVLEAEDNDAYMSIITGFKMTTTAKFDANGKPIPIVPEKAVLLERATAKEPKGKKRR